MKNIKEFLEILKNYRRKYCDKSYIYLWNFEILSNKNLKFWPFEHKKKITTAE